MKKNNDLSAQDEQLLKAVQNIYTFVHLKELRRGLFELILVYMKHEGDEGIADVFTDCLPDLQILFGFLDDLEDIPVSNT